MNTLSSTHIQKGVETLGYNTRHGAKWVRWIREAEGSLEKRPSEAAPPGDRIHRARRQRTFYPGRGDIPIGTAPRAAAAHPPVHSHLITNEAGAAALHLEVATLNQIDEDVFQVSVGEPQDDNSLVLHR